MGVFRKFRTTTANIEEVRPTVWTEAVTAQRYQGVDEKYQAAVMDQYKIYLEMADRVSARRGLTNTFFLTLNTLVFTAIGIFWRDKPNAALWSVSLPTVALLLQCAAWFWLLRSYRQLNSAKYVIVGVLEERLPASPYWRAEWKALGEGRDSSRYWPLTHLEQWIPFCFATTYVAAFIAILAG
ncbi:hypothetical protein [Actinoplanes sp. NBRC 103695]|uniref:RipA family octameric membrane protein n=1 Tax=Actinoplanes sp. NBRC 103695 TaxID=3032202 RepID=UPI0025526FFD|nr:hypothetical protein [Actinoplanes sp. NBRC 103695]